VANLGRERCLHLWTEQSLLILLLRFITATIEGMQRGAVAQSPIVDPAVPNVSVHHDN
jgi:hypothetical protein